MAANKPKLDDATIKIVKQILSMPPKPHDKMKVGRPKKEKKRGVKVRASSSKPRSAS
jgi:hypothetical protein